MTSRATQPTFADDHPPALVGREREQALLAKHLAAALGGRGSLVLVGGEAGIGKTTLAEVLLRDAELQGALVLVGHCYDLAETPPYGPWREGLTTIPRSPDVPPLPAAVAGGVLGAVASREALFRQLHDVLAAAAARRPLVLLLDDVHWADAASLDLLRFLARQLAPLALLVVATYRADELTRRHPLYQLLPALVREARAARLDLKPLTEGDVRALVRARYPLDRDEEGRLVGYLQERAEGNPFYLGELLRTLEEEGVLRPEGDRWALGDLSQGRVPALLRQVVDGRLARLGEEAHRLLAVAAVIGHEAPLDLWAAVSEAGEEELIELVERAAGARLVEPTGAGLRFAHALIREALYEATNPLRRRGWHRRAGEVLAGLPSPDPDAVAFHLRQAGDARAAEWLVRAGERAQRAWATLTAAERYEGALALMQGDEARAGERGWLLLRLARLRQYVDPRAGLAAADEAARLAAAAGDRALAAAAPAERGLLQGFLGEPQRGLPALEVGAAAVDALAPDERARLNRLLTLDLEASDLNPYWALLAVARGNVGPFPQALALWERLAPRVPAPSPGGSLSAAGGRPAGAPPPGRAVAGAMLGRPEEARRAFAEARAAYRAAENHFLLGMAAENELKVLALPYLAEQLATRRRLAAEVEAEHGRAGGAGVVRPQFFCAPLLVLEGRWDEAHALALEVRASAEFAAVRRGAMGWLGVLARARGEPEEAWAQVRTALPEGPAAPPEVINAHDGLGLQRLALALALDAGDLATAREWLEAYDRWLAWSGAVLYRAEGLLDWAAYHRAAGDLDLARQHAERALAHATEPRQPLALLAAHRLLGELDTAAGDYAQAQTHLDQAMALADACAAPYERALCLLSLGELRTATGGRDEALALLDEVRTICTPLGAKPALARAEILAARLAAEPPPTLVAARGLPAGLTAREAEVLRLVAQGLSDAEVAERLFVSVNTVKTHLRSIYGKLDVPSRTAAARFAAEHKLT